TMTGNQAVSAGTGTTYGARGGAIYAAGNASILNSTIVGNSSTRYGGGIYATEAIMIKNSIVSGDSSPHGACYESQPGYIVSGGGNDTSDNSCALNQIGDIHGSPSLAPLAKNGGFVMTKAEYANSKTVDHGSHAGCPIIDARGITRPQGKHCDIGAYELVPKKKKK